MSQSSHFEPSSLNHPAPVDPAALSSGPMWESMIKMVSFGCTTSVAPICCSYSSVHGKKRWPPVSGILYSSTVFISQQKKNMGNFKEFQTHKWLSVADFHLCPTYRSGRCYQLIISGHLCYLLHLIKKSLFLPRQELVSNQGISLKHIKTLIWNMMEYVWICHVLFRKSTVRQGWSIIHPLKDC